MSSGRHVMAHVTMLMSPNWNKNHIVNPMEVMDAREPNHLQPKEFFGIPVFENGDIAYEEHNVHFQDESEDDGEQDFAKAPPRQHRFNSQDSFSEAPDDTTNANITGGGTSSKQGRCDNTGYV